jgi:hypothetical protein
MRSLSPFGSIAVADKCFDPDDWRVTVTRTTFGWEAHVRPIRPGTGPGASYWAWSKKGLRKTVARAAKRAMREKPPATQPLNEFLQSHDIGKKEWTK